MIFLMLNSWYCILIHNLIKFALIFNLKTSDILFAERSGPLFYPFKTLARKYLAYLDLELCELEIERYYLILFLVIRQQHITQQHLCNMLDIDKASMARMVDYLSRKGYVNRVVNPDDRRSHVIVPTSEAISAYRQIGRAFQRINTLCLKGFSQQEASLFYKMLGRINSNLCSSFDNIHINNPETNKKTA